jgi:hypothetical protein
MWMTLEGILMSENINFSAIFIDSLNTFHYTDKKSFELATNCLLKLSTEFGVSLFATKSPMSSFKTNEFCQQKEIMFHEWTRHVHFRLHLEENLKAKVFDLKNKKNSEICKFSIVPSGIRFD